MFPKDPAGVELNIPVVVEVWAEPAPKGNADFMVNGTPIVGDAGGHHARKDRTMRLYGGGLWIDVPKCKAPIWITQLPRG